MYSQWWRNAPTELNSKVPGYLTTGYLTASYSSEDCRRQAHGCKQLAQSHYAAAAP